MHSRSAMYLKLSRLEWPIYASRRRCLASPQIPFFIPAGPVRLSALEDYPAAESAGQRQIVGIFEADARREALGNSGDFYCLSG